MAKTKNSGGDIVKRRLYARGIWKLHSAAYFGGSQPDMADMSLLRDADGNPFIPGASIAGAARSFLARQRQPWAKYKKKIEGKSLKRLFGGDMRQNRAESEKNKDTMSALIVDDAVCIGEQTETSIRDGVCIEHTSGSAATGGKFNVEVVERDTEFELNLECVIRQVDNQSGLKDGRKKPNLEELFLALLHAFEQGDIRLGAKTRRGYGRGKVDSWEIRDLQMHKSEDVMAWLRDDAWSQPKSQLTTAALPSDKREYFHIEADFKLRTSLLIRSSSGDPKAPDMVHIQSAGKPLVPGTSFAGAFRHRATLIAKTIGCPESAVDKMFGYVYEKEGNGTQEADALASRVHIEEHLVQNVEERWQDRVAIDRFTGGSLDGALFSQKPVYPLSFKEPFRYHLRLTLTLEEPENSEIGLLLLTLRDFWHGHAALGGETSNGRGTLSGLSAKLRLKRHTSSDPDEDDVWKLAKLEDDMETQPMALHTKSSIHIEGDAVFLERCVTAAQTYVNQPVDSPRPDKEQETPDG